MVLMVLPALNISASARGISIDLNDSVTATDYGPEGDYTDLISKILEDGISCVMRVGAIYEQQRNSETESLDVPYEDTGDYTGDYTGGDTSDYTGDYTDNSATEEIPAGTEEDGYQNLAYTDEDLDLLARIINAEAGCDWIPDWVQQMVGSVVINRVNSQYFPNTIREVIYQPGQYGPVYNGMINYTPSQRVIENARYVLENGSTCPANVTGQNGEVSGGGVYTSYYDSILGTTIYFCYT